RARIQPSIGRCRHRRPAQTLLATAEAALDSGTEAGGTFLTLTGTVGIAVAQQLGRGAQSGDSPEVVPIVVVVEPEMLGTEAGRQQSGMWRLRLLRQALAGNPPGPLEHCGIPACIQAPTGELLIAPQYPQHFPIRIPLSFLGAEVAQRGLA